MLPTLASLKVGEAAVIDNLLAETNYWLRQTRTSAGQPWEFVPVGRFRCCAKPGSLFHRSLVAHHPLGELYV